MDASGQSDIAQRVTEMVAPPAPTVPVKLAIGLGDAELEQRLLPALHESGAFIVAERCLSGEELRGAVRSRGVDAILVASDLHRLTEDILQDAQRSGIPVVLLVPVTEEPLWQSLTPNVLAFEADAEALRDALLSAVHGEAKPKAMEAPREITPVIPATQGRDAALGTLLAVTSGYGSPGRTTIAVNLAVALGAVASTILVDADLIGPAIAACLNLDPTRNLYMLAHAEPDSAGDWERALEQESQPLGRRSPKGRVLCGVPKPELRNAISSRFLERLLEHLQQRYQYVVVDAGADLLDLDGTAHRALKTRTAARLYVVSADLVGIYQARRSLASAGMSPGAEGGPIIVINRFDRRENYNRTEIEWALGAATAAVIPHEHRPVQRAVQAQRPLIYERHSRAARALLDLAERVCEGTIVLPPEEPKPSRFSRLKRKPAWLTRPPWLTRPRRPAHLPWLTWKPWRRHRRQEINTAALEAAVGDTDSD